MAQQKAVESVEEVDDLIDELQPGAKLLKGQYTITRYLNSGGFGITYLAKDSLDRDVVIKECFPSSVCRRSKVMVAARSRAHTAELRSVIQLFVREARNLAKIVHPNIVAVHQVFEDNGTAYMAIDYIDGMDLQQIIDGEGEMLSPAHIVRITDKLLTAVGFIHDHDMLHRDISPDNVLINKTGEPILIDFGAAREHASKTTRAMSALRVVKDGYSPQEFYIAGSEQGPWSDLYALAATLYHLISGEAPVNGQARLGALAEDRPDPYVAVSGRFEGYPPGYLEAIDRALSTLPKARLQTAADWLAMYRNQESPAGSSVEDVVQQLVKDFKQEDEQAPPVATTSAPALLAKATSRLPEEAPPTAPAARGKSPVQLVAGVAVALIVVAGGYLMLVNPDGAAIGTTTAAPSETLTTPAMTAATATATVATVETAGTETAKEQTAAAALVDAKPEEPGPAPVAAPEDSAAALNVEPEVTVEAPKVEPEETAESSADNTQEATVATDVSPVTEATAAGATETAAAEAAFTNPEVEIAASAPKAAPVAEDPAPDTTDAAALPEPAAEPDVETSVAGPKPAATQVALAVWDVKLPFTADDRVIGGQPLTIVQRLAPGLDRASAGSWLQQGLLIYAVNGKPTPTASALTTAILNAMQVDPDGKARVVVEYAGSDLERQIDLLTVDAVRIVSLVNGVTVRSSMVDGAWKTEVTAITRPETTTLKLGDILFRDKTTATPLDEATSLEQIISALIDKGVTDSEFSIIRDTKVASATLKLVQDGGQ